MSIDRIQGTDGIRRPVARGVKGLTPQEAFLQRGVITPAFMELYTYAYVTGLRDRGEVVIGWDPRDPEGVFTDAAVRGIRKAGATAVVVGVCPTPGVAMYLVWRGAAAAFMVTASHNFRDQNGIKIFHGPRALKLFPDDDRALTKRVLGIDYGAEVERAAVAGAEVDAGAEAREVFRNFHVDPRNSWLKLDERLGDFPLVVDTANGALSGIAGEVFRVLHAGPVIEVNTDVESGHVNRHSGVADLEGVTEIAPDDLRFAEHDAVREVFATKGKAAVFDADGDRFYRLDFDATSGRIFVLSGDETAVHQARHMTPVPEGTLYINTVESDLNAARAAADLGYTPLLTGVGDKWVLRQAADHPDRYGIGSEETGHNISKGVLETRAGEEREVFFGNGLKSALNTFVATRGMTAAQARHPFEPGFKRTFYVYYTQKELLYKDSEVLKGAAEVIRQACSIGPTEPMDRPEEPDMLYLAVNEGGHQRAGIFVRNSGTEEKTGVNVRGGVSDGDALVAVGELVALYLARVMKDRDHPMAKAEEAVLKALADGPKLLDDLPIPDGIHQERLLEELANKEKVIRRCDGGYERTDFGKRMLEAWA